MDSHGLYGIWRRTIVFGFGVHFLEHDGRYGRGLRLLLDAIQRDRCIIIRDVDSKRPVVEFARRPDVRGRRDLQELFPVNPYFA